MSDRDIPVSKADNSVEPELAPTMRERGKPFEKGNGGRKPGSRNRTTVIASALMEGQEAELVQTGLALAKAGNIPMLKLFLERMLPKEPPIHLELPPLRTLSDAKEAMALITKAMAEGKISPSQGAAVASVTDRFTRAVEFTEISKKVADLEEKLNSDWALLKEQLKGMAS